ncbi:uncharacterized protein ARMOST_10350 [Armillaria ostoyae]|uniref:Uncharacterized protein n=1 Tax=Armillaria ostoyae TaxID=47428 RepID=A0A284RE12_ARMOS|nr:uncharacterized protein ARMOST_10350 [Armillaria ostoyae]
MELAMGYHAFVPRRAEWWVKRRLDESSENHCPGSYNRLEFYVYSLDFILKAHEASASTSTARRRLVFFHHGTSEHQDIAKMVRIGVHSHIHGLGFDDQLQPKG